MLYYDEIYLYARNLEQDKYKRLIQKMRELSMKLKLSYDILHVSNDKITPVTEMDYEDNQKLVVFDDYVCDKNQRQLIDYFIQGRHKNCSVTYLSQSFYKTPKDIRLNCSHYCLYEFPSSREANRISSELGIDKETDAATKKYVDDNSGGGKTSLLTVDSNIDMKDRYRILNLKTPSDADEAATKSYSDDNFLKTDGSIRMKGELHMGANRITNITDPTGEGDAATKKYTDNLVNTTVADYVKRDGTVAMNGDFNTGGHKILNLRHQKVNQQQKIM